MASTVTTAFIGCNGMTNIMAHLDSKGVSTVKPMARKRKSMQEQAKVAAKLVAKAKAAEAKVAAKALAKGKGKAKAAIRWWRQRQRWRRQS